MSGPPGDRGNPGRRVSAVQNVHNTFFITNRGLNVIYFYIKPLLITRAPKVSKDKQEAEETQAFAETR